MSHSLAPAASDAGGIHINADAMFAQMMIPHHEQAVQMSDIMLAKDDLDPQITQLAEDEAANGQDPDAVALAETIVADQKAEIEKMNNLLAAI